MAAVKRSEERTLRELLDGLQLSQRQDIKAYSGGHLNESNLWKPPDKATHKSWKSAKKEHITLVPRNRLLQARDEHREKDKLGEAIASFSLGTAGTIPLPPATKKPLKGTKGPLKVKFQRRNGSAKSEDSQDSYAKQDDGILVEELKLPEVVLRKSSASPCTQIEHVDNAEEKETLTNRSTARTRDNYKYEPKAQFLQGFQEAVTKKDQFVKFKTFESEVLRLQDTNEKHVLTGIKAVEKLETKLREDLMELCLKEEPNNDAVSFQRLQVYSESFDDLVHSTPTFKHILGQIKKEYDDYVSYLLASQPNKHQELHSQMEQLSARRSLNPRILRFESERVHGLEKEAKDLLDENERLRRELQKELELAQDPGEEEPKIRVSSATDRPSLDLVGQIEELRSTLLERLDKLNEMRHKLKTDFVPRSVCTHLEQCIKETEVEIQRLTSQKEYYEKNIAEMETELQELIETADTTEKDAKRVWKRINAVKAISRGGQVIFGYDSESETDEEAKWNWYIS